MQRTVRFTPKSGLMQVRRGLSIHISIGRHKPCTAAFWAQLFIQMRSLGDDP
jgi:hypothetical protein